MWDNLAVPRPVLTTLPMPIVNAEATMANLPFANEEEIGLFNEAFATSLASPLINADHPADPVTLTDAISSPDANL